MASVEPLSNLVSILTEISDSIYLVTGNEGERVLKTFPTLKGYSINYKSREFIPFKILGHILLQFRISYQILKFNNHVSTYVFFMGDSLFLPALISKLTGKPVVWALAGSLKKMFGNETSFISRSFVWLEMLNYKLADIIVAYSPNLIDEWGLDKYRYKVSIAHEHYIATEQSPERLEFKKRNVEVGYVGRLNQEKGILNFIRAIPSILNTNKEVKFLIGGDGQLKNEVISFLKEKELGEKVELSGWIPHDNLSSYLKGIKLLVLPSYTEGLPNIMLEAMACGTAVLATQVGAIPGVIKDGETGFILANNSPEYIAENVLRALNHPNLEQVAENGRALVQKEFTFAAAVEGWRGVLGKLGNR
jgi:glycosyltransferase involved in cell wall biosynthesis